MKSTTTNGGSGQGLFLDAGMSKTTKHFAHAALAVLQVVGFLVMLACLILTGPSVWTLLAGIAAAVVTKANLSIMGRLPDFGDDADAMDELARFTIGVPTKRR